MSVINALVMGEEDLRKRGLLRQEFMGTGLIVTLAAKTPPHLGQNVGFHVELLCSSCLAPVSVPLDFKDLKPQRKPGNQSCRVIFILEI